MDSKPLIELQQVSKIFGEDIAVDQVNLKIYPGEFFSLLGSSGCGKSSLLRLLAGFETPSHGNILLDGEDITHLPPFARPINMMFQSYALFPHMTVAQNIAFGLKQDRMNKTQIKHRVDHMLELVELNSHRHRKPHQLSGGQCQRVALARCLAKRPKVLLLDEPLSALDKNLREQMQFQLVDIQEALGTSFLMVTHDQAEAMTMSTRIGLMHQGRLLQTGTPNEVYEFPLTRFSARFMGQVNIFNCQFIDKQTEHALLRSEQVNSLFYISRSIEGIEEQNIYLGIRPEKMMISKEPPEDYQQTQPVNCITGFVEDIAYLGGLSTYHVRIDENLVIKATDFNVERRADHPTWKDRVYLTWDSANVMVLPA